MTMNNIIDTGLNYQFIVENFIKAKKGLKKQELTGIIDPNRIKGVALEGGSRTGKSFDTSTFVNQYIDSYEGKMIVIGRDTLTSLKNSTYETLRAVWNLFNYPSSHFNKSATDIQFKGNIIKFIGVNDNLEDAKGLESDLLWLNETLSINKEALDQLEQRCKEFFIYDYNPSASEHYLFDKELRSDYKVLKTVIFDNPHAPINSVEKILSYAHPDTDDYDHIKNKIEFNKRFKSREQWQEFKERNVELKTADKYMWEVYGLGKRGKSEDIIFKDIYRYEDEVTDYDWKAYGGDFGFKSDPTSLVQVIKKGNNIYLKQCIHETGLLNNDIAHKMLDNNWIGEYSLWDASEQKSVYELAAYGIPAYAPKKTHIAWGIQKIQQFNLHIHIDSKDCYNEFSTYKYLKKADGDHKRNTLGHKIAIDKDNHSIDATRYVLHFYYLNELNE